tara:strand:- start:6675 stop:6899 length:225 start_codon:yes stop_codon:yes gene_type:complete
MPKRGSKKPSQFLGYITPIKEGKKWVLKSLCLGMVNPIGSRLKRNNPWPISEEVFATKKEALEAADKLNQYLKA